VVTKIQSATRPDEFARGLLASTPMLLGLIPAALVLGAQATAKGMAPPAVSLMTGLNFAGGSEFAAIGLWRAPRWHLCCGTCRVVARFRSYS
jgi:predicted branched-subunit amino acid permease